jgi:hypothetical protein
VLTLDESDRKMKLSWKWREEKQNKRAQSERFRLAAKCIHIDIDFQLRFPSSSFSTTPYFAAKSRPQEVTAFNLLVFHIVLTGRWAEQAGILGK